jgi:signal transduction histidine kinase
VGGRGPSGHQGVIGLTVAAFLAVPALAHGPGQDPARSVLVLFEAEPSVPSTVLLDAGVREALGAHDGERVRVYVEHLDLQRFPSPEHSARLAAWLGEKYRGFRLEAVLAESEALGFALAHRDRVGAGAPIAFFDLEERVLESGAAPLLADPGLTGLTRRSDVVGTARLARALLPGARLAVVAGASAGERAGVRLVLDELAAAGIPALDLGALALEQLEGAVAALPGDAAVLFLTFRRDAAGRHLVPSHVARRLARGSPRPVFVHYDHQVGEGAVGGVVHDARAMGRDAGALALRLVHGEDAAAIPRRRGPEPRPVVDARALARFGIPEARVPPGVEVRFRAPNLWRDHREGVLAGAAVLAAQAVLIAVLLLERRRRRRAEGAARRTSDLELQLAHLDRVSSLGALSASLAHELGQPLTAIGSNAHAAAVLLDRDPPDLAEVRAAVEAIAEDDRRASQVVRRMRRLLERGEVRKELVDLADVARDALKLLATEARHRKASVELQVPAQPLRSEGDPVQLLQVVLNLVQNALQVGARRVVVSLCASQGGALLEVRDDGPGISGEHASRIFEPFYTTRAGGMGMGLSICRTIVESHGGRIGASAAPGGGALLQVILPTPAGDAVA